MLLCPRDYLSTFLKITTILVLAVAILVILPPLRMPALTPFATLGEGPVFAGKLFPFAFITIACGAISGFHSLVASGTTPKMIARESDARMIGYGGMLMESFVGVMAMIAACTLDPGVYFAMNTTPAALAQASQTLGQAGFVVTPETMQALAARMGEATLVARSGGAPSLAVGMAQIFSALPGMRGLMAYWYHFAIMFEAVFILTTIDSGTRIGRFLIQEFGGSVWKPLGRTDWMPGAVLASLVMVLGWSYFIWTGSIATIWPMFGIGNQLLAALALAVATTMIINQGNGKYAWVTFVPLCWVGTTTFAAGYMSIRDNFWPMTLADDPTVVTTGYVDTVCTIFMMVCATVILAATARRSLRVLTGRVAIAMEPSEA
jgi:carbon starvation protein